MQTNELENGRSRPGRRQRTEETHSQGDPISEPRPEEYGAVEEMIQRGIETAKQDGVLINEHTARAIARALALGLDNHESTLAEFAASGKGNLSDLYEEYAPICSAQSTPPAVMDWIDWLGTYLVAMRYPEIPLGTFPYRTSELPKTLINDLQVIAGNITRVHRSVVQTESLRNAMWARLQPILSGAGDSFRASLTLPDVDAGSDEILDRFRSDFIGDFANATKALDATTELPGWERELVAWARARGLDGMVSIDRQRFEDLAREVWDFVEFGGRCYVFAK